MPPRRTSVTRSGCTWGDVHRRHLLEGADRPNQQFGAESVRCRRRQGAVDFENMPLVERAWADLKDEILSTVADPIDCWAYRRFEMHVEPLGIDTGPVSRTPPAELVELAVQQGIEAARKAYRSDPHRFSFTTT